MSTGETTGSFEYRSDIDEALEYIQAILAIDVEGNVTDTSPAHAQRLRDIAATCEVLATAIETQAAARMAETAKEAATIETPPVENDIRNTFVDYFLSRTDELPEVETPDELHALELFVEELSHRRNSPDEAERLKRLRGILLRANGAVYRR
jgi:hypothetical protein